MYLIVGLGNPEREYRWTRHNVGFEVINKMAYDNNIDVSKNKFRALIGEGFIGGKKVILAKPQTYMNLSGESVKEIMNYYRLDKEDIIVLYDDIALDVGAVRIRERGSAGGQNGMKNIIKHLNTDDFIRVRIGIGEKPPRMKLSDYVLSKFLKEEEDAIIKGMTLAGDGATMIVTDGVQPAMNKFNVSSNKKNNQ